MIQFAKASRNYGEFTALDEAEFSVAAGEIVVLLGENGAGKSTALALAAGALPASSGEVRIAGECMDPDNLELKRQVGLVPASDATYDALTPVEFVAFIGSLYGLPAAEARSAAATMLDRFGVGTAARLPLGTASFGTRRKCMVAAALLHRPRIVLADEPFNGLDPRSARSLRAFFRAEADAGSAVLIATHDLHTAETLADRLVILHAGRVRASGRLTDVLARPEGGADTDLESAVLRWTDDVVGLSTTGEPTIAS